MLRAALVDVGGTLWSESAWSSQEMAALRRGRLLQAGVPAGTVDSLLAIVGAEASAAEGVVPYMDIQQVLRGCLERAGLDGFEPESLRRAWSVDAVQMVPLLPGAAQFLRSVKDLGLRCHILSNAFVRTAAEYRLDFKAQGLAEWIDGVTSSVDAGWRKPDPRIFEAAAAAAGAPPGECVMVGNSEQKDIVPARALGMRAIRVAIEEPPPPSSAADAVCASLQEAGERLAELVRA